MDGSIRVYQLQGEVYESLGEFLSALAHEYRTGDRDLVLTALDEYGLDLSDINHGR
jgi:hypothetical protein